VKVVPPDRPEPGEVATVAAELTFCGFGADGVLLAEWVGLGDVVDFCGVAFGPAAVDGWSPDDTPSAP
jgi:hypothetical protein